MILNLHKIVYKVYTTIQHFYKLIFSYKKNYNYYSIFVKDLYLLYKYKKIFIATQFIFNFILIFHLKVIKLL